MDNMRPMGEFASHFLFEANEKGCSFLYSDLVVEELQKAYSPQKIALIFQPYLSNLRKVPITREQALESKQLARTRTESHRQDILHAILARDNHATLVTRDKGFESLTDMVVIARPEEIRLD
jgi:predicted nucleic acid-binding protein